MKKLVLLTISATAFLSLGTAFAQDNGKVNFYDVVPRHEFFVEGFGGFAPLIYDVTTYAQPSPTGGPVQGATVGVENHSILWPWVAAKDPNNLFSAKYPVGVGYGGGFGYIYHFHRVWGFMTGIEAAMYNGGINLFNEDAPYMVWTTGLRDGYIEAVGLESYQETQRYLNLQIPLMMQVMAPMGKGNHFFYTAFGAKLGINVYGRFHATAEAAYRLELPYSETWQDIGNAANMFGDIPNHGTGTYVSPSGKDGYGSTLYGNQFDGKFSEQGACEYEGPFRASPLNAIAALELGFRWKLAKGWGLYTGLYADFGLQPVEIRGKGVAIQQEPNSREESYQSILVSGGLPEYYFREKDAATPGTVPTKEYMSSTLPTAVSAIYSLHTGLKLKLAFGKVKKAPEPVVLPPKPDTVVKTVVQTVVVRDTVVKNNTVVVRDTVEKINTVVVRDTVVVIKEVPQEIKDVMVELSNTLFAFNKFNLTDKARQGLNKVADWLNENPDVKVEISGHTDGVGSDSYNQKLSEQRAKSVYEYFIHEGGVSSKRLSYKGYGKSQPIATNDTEEGRQMNRRVELNIIQ